MHDDSPPASGRREARRRDRRDAILTVAQTYFLEHGYAGTTMSGVAAALGGSKGTLWNHFPSKEDLFTAVLDRVAKAYRMRLAQILDSKADLAQVLTLACRSIIIKVTSREAVALHRLIISEGGRFPELSRIFFDLAPGNTSKLMAEFLAGAMERGELRRDDPCIAARALMAIAMSGTHKQMLMGLIDRPSGKAVDADAAMAVDIFLRAYAPGGSGTPGGHSA